MRSRRRRARAERLAIPIHARGVWPRFCCLMFCTITLKCLPDLHSPRKMDGTQRNFQTSLWIPSSAAVPPYIRRERDFRLQELFPFFPPIQSDWPNHSHFSASTPMKRGYMSHHFDTKLAKEDPSLNVCDFYLF